MAAPSLGPVPIHYSLEARTRQRFAVLTWYLRQNRWRVFEFQMAVLIRNP